MSARTAQKFTVLMLCRCPLDTPSQFGWSRCSTVQSNSFSYSSESIAIVEFLSHIGFLVKVELNLKQLLSIWNILDKLRRHQGTTALSPAGSSPCHLFPGEACTQVREGNWEGCWEPSAQGPLTLDSIS